MIISQSNPSPGVDFATLAFSLEDEYGTGTYSFVIKADVLQEPRLISTSCFKIPLFVARADLAVPTGELLITIGRADDSEPHSQVFLLPRYIKGRPDHHFEVMFQDWKIVKAELDGTMLQMVSAPDQVILIHQGIEHLASACDLLRPNGSLSLVISGDLGLLGVVPLLELSSSGFDFSLGVEGGEIVLRRNGYEIHAYSDKSEKSLVWVLWSPTQLQLILPYNRDQTTWSVTTPIAVCPKSLLQLARVKKLQPTTSFASTQAFRTAVHEALCSLQDDIAEFGAYGGFWDQRYDGRRKGRPTPKKETDIHQQLLLPLSDWAKMRSIEVIRENQTAVGRLDICLIGNVDGEGPVSFCVEVKLAHAADLEHGLAAQLPAYMATKRAIYGAFVVLWFKGNWFDQPSSDAIRRLRESTVSGSAESSQTDFDVLEFALVTKTALNPDLRNVRVFLVDVSKPVSASRRS